VADLLPAAALVPTPAGAAGEGAGITPDAPERLLASLPLKLVPGALPAEVQSGGGAPVMLGLGVAWASVLLAIAAVAGLLVGAVALSERRAVFVSAVTHELRTPLTTFRTYTEMLSRGMVPEGSRGQYLDTLFREAERLCHLTENVLLYSRLERGGGGHRVEEVDLHDLVARVEARLGARLREAGMTIDGAPPGSPTAPVRARGDATAIEQILFNVVDNACKYAAAADDRQIRIRIRAGSGGGTAVVEMSDGGPGIPAADRRRLFRPFSRSARDAAGRAPGVGLGLALSRRLARGMGGDLQLADSPTGARFVLTLPAV
jgi:signal transduction histidine kinase